MAVVLVRIDDRLVHGQVVEAWIPQVRAELVLVASDAAAADPTQVMLMRLALPEAVGLKVLGYKAAAEALRSPEVAAKRTLVLAPGPLDVLGLLDEGAVIGRVNVGGLHHSAGQIQIGRAIFLTELDRAALREIGRRGVVLEGRAIPGEPPADVLAAVGKEAA